VTAQAGAAYFKITVEGRQVYTPFLPIPKTLSEHPSAIVKMARVVEALEVWGRRYSEANTLELGEGGERIVPKVSMGAIRGGVPYKIGTSVGRCSLYLDVRLPPGKTPAEVERELHGVIRGLGLEARVENYLFRQGYRASGAEPLIAALRRAHAEIHGAPPSPPPPPLTSMWQDMNVFNQVGIPSVSYGPFVMRTVETGVPRDYVVVEDLHRVAQVYALTALSLCGGKEVLA
jgi:acetylornithine deacetylase/succinyl-diaminopimelate desuccinylase-like protein